MPQCPPPGPGRVAPFLAGWVLACGLASCSTDEPPPEPPEPPAPPTAQEHYEAGLEALKGQSLLFFFTNIDYPAAIAHFQEVIDNYPYSEYAVLAELKIADAHFARHDFEEAASFYQDFVELHPSHAKVPYAIYRNGLCSYERMRQADRDQKPTHEAIAQFEALLERHPDSDLADDARAKLAEAYARLAERELLVADFYFQRGIHHAAVPRYRRGLEGRPDAAQQARALSRLGISLARIGQTLEAEQVLRRALAETEEEDLREEILAELERLADLPIVPGSPAPEQGGFVGE